MRTGTVDTSPGSKNLAVGACSFRRSNRDGRAARRDESPHSLLSNLAGVVLDVEFLEVIAYRGTDTWGYVALAPSAVAELRANMPYFDLAFASIAADREALSVVSGD